VATSAARWLLTAVFAGLGGYCLARCALPAARRIAHARSAWLTDALGVAMSATMIVMLWAVPVADRWGVRLALFGTAGGWYLVRASRSGTRPDVRIGLVHHGIAMAAMFWMVVAAPAGTATMAHAVMAGTGPGSPVPGAAGPIGTGLAAYLSLAALWWARSAMRPAPREVGAVPLAHGVFGARGAAICQAVMASAMGVALLVH
jgi:hypothetical protein